MIVWIASYPRSGNRFFRAIFHSVYGVETHQIGKLPKPASAWLDAAAASPQWHYVKTHDLPAGDRHPAVYLLRDGRDALVSHAWFTLTVLQNKVTADITPAEFHATLKQVIVEPHPRFGDWSDNVRAWTQRPNTIVVRYEDLVSQPRELVIRTIEELGLPPQPLPDAAIPTFAQMQRQDPRMVRRGKVGSWQDEFPEDLLPVFWQRHGTVMHRVGYAAERAGRAAA